MAGNDWHALKTHYFQAGGPQHLDDLFSVHLIQIENQGARRIAVAFGFEFCFRYQHRHITQSKSNGAQFPLAIVGYHPDIAS